MRTEKIYISVEAYIQYKPGFRGEAKRVAEDIVSRISWKEGSREAQAWLTGKTRKRKPTKGAKQ
jgi:hypothetical protein